MMNIFTPTLPRGERKNVDYTFTDSIVSRPFGLNFATRNALKPRPRRAKKNIQLEVIVCKHLELELTK